MKTLVLGIGNPILGDDGIGCRVAQEIADQVEDENVDVKDTGIDGLDLLELIVGYDKLIIIDAIMTASGEVGEIYRLKPESLVRSVHITTSPHNANLPTTIEIGRKVIPEQMPGEIVVFAVEINEVTEFTEEMTASVVNALPKVLSLVLEEIGPINCN